MSPIAIRLPQKPFPPSTPACATTARRLNKAPQTGQTAAALTAGTVAVTACQPLVINPPQQTKQGGQQIEDDVTAAWRERELLHLTA